MFGKKDLIKEMNKDFACEKDSKYEGCYIVKGIRKSRKKLVFPDCISGLNDHNGRHPKWEKTKEVIFGENFIDFPLGFFENSMYLKVADFSRTTKMQYIHRYLFSNSNIEKVILPSTIKVIKEKAFYECKWFKDINLENVEIVESEAFYSCKSLKNINLNNVKIIGRRAFLLCNAKMTFGNKLEEIGYNALPSNIKVCDLPTSVKRLGVYTVDLSKGCITLIGKDNVAKSLKEDNIDLYNMSVNKAIEILVDTENYLISQAQKKMQREQQARKETEERIKKEKIKEIDRKIKINDFSIFNVSKQEKDNICAIVLGLAQDYMFGDLKRGCDFDSAVKYAKLVKEHSSILEQKKKADQIINDIDVAIKTTELEVKKMEERIKKEQEDKIRKQQQQKEEEEELERLLKYREKVDGFEDSAKYFYDKGQYSNSLDYIEKALKELNSRDIDGYFSLEEIKEKKEMLTNLKKSIKTKTTPVSKPKPVVTENKKVSVQEQYQEALKKETEKFKNNAPDLNKTVIVYNGVNIRDMAINSSNMRDCLLSGNFAGFDMVYERCKDLQKVDFESAERLKSSAMKQKLEYIRTNSPTCFAQLIVDLEELYGKAFRMMIDDYNSKSK